MKKVCQADLASNKAFQSLPDYTSPRVIIPEMDESPAKRVDVRIFDGYLNETKQEAFAMRVTKLKPSLIKQFGGPSPQPVDTDNSLSLEQPSTQMTKHKKK